MIGDEDGTKMKVYKVDIKRLKEQLKTIKKESPEVASYIDLQDVIIQKMAESIQVYDGIISAIPTDIVNIDAEDAEKAAFDNMREQVLLLSACLDGASYSYDHLKCLQGFLSGPW